MSRNLKITAQRNPRASSRSPDVSAHMAADGVPTVPCPAADARRASQRKLPTARSAPARIPSPPAPPAIQAAGSARRAAARQVSRVTRIEKLVAIIKLPLGALHRSKETHEPRHDPQQETAQREPWCRPQPPVTEIPAGQTDDRADDHGHSDRGQLGEPLPGRRLPGWRHVKEDTSTTIQSAQADRSP